jgi:hypothetical protein
MMTGTRESRDWDQLRSDAISAAREITGDDTLAEQVTDAVLGVVDEETVRALCDDHIARTNLRSLDFRNGGTLDIQPAREMVAYWVGAARALLGDAENYSETRVDFGIPEDPQRYAFIVQRAGKLTPHEARKQAEAERDEARAELEQLRARLKAARVMPQPKLSEREIAALAALASRDTAITGNVLAGRMKKAGRATTTAAAHQAGAALARKGLAIKGQLGDDPYSRVRYELTNKGREWITAYRQAGDEK